MRPDPERVSLDLIRRKLAEVSDEELAELVGAERLLRTLSATVDTAGVCPWNRGCLQVSPLIFCKTDPGVVCSCCPKHRCGA